MHRENLRANLTKLRTELGDSAERLDDDLHELLRGVADDIEHLLGDEPPESQPGREQLRELAVKFETDHPRLARILEEVADTVAKLGI